MDPMTMTAIMSAISAIPGFAKMFGFGAGKNPSDVASKQLNQIPGKMGQYYNPYIKQGQDVNPYLQDLFKGATGNPGEMLNKIGAGYQQSPGYQNTLKTAQGAVNNASAAGGMLGTPLHQQASADIAGNVANQDYGNYMKNALGLFDTGAAGLGNLSNQGFDASKGMGDMQAQLQNALAGYGFAGQHGQNESRGQGLAEIGGAAGGFFNSDAFKNWIKQYMTQQSYIPSMSA